MGSESYIHMQGVNMYYPSGIYNASTLKQEIFSRLRLEKKKPLLKDVHALKDLDIEIKEGERVGVIGRNGSGKSTLLKTIAGIYPIESGTLEVQGKIRALFDIGLGFDLESTGRENILYRGLLLGATPEEIAEKTEEIIEFADIGDFINYPVKSYSSGMLVRLAFAVSTSITGDVLLLDEVLGAGDMGFIEKAKKRIYHLIDEAKLMVLVTHDMGSALSLCNRVILLRNGIKVADGDPKEVIEIYRASLV